MALSRSVYDLQVYRRAFEVSLDLHTASLAWPKHEQYGGIADQIRRASKGICANLAEGFGKQESSLPEFGRFLSIAMGSTHEVRVWLDYVLRLNYETSAKVEGWKQEYDEIRLMLGALKAKVKP